MLRGGKLEPQRPDCKLMMLCQSSEGWVEVVSVCMMYKFI